MLTLNNKIVFDNNKLTKKITFNIKFAAQFVIAHSVGVTTKTDLHV